MARGRRSKTAPERVATHNANALRALLGAAEETYATPSWPLSPLLEIQDNRQFHPEGAYRRPLSVFGSGAEWSVDSDAKRNQAVLPKSGLRMRPTFRDPSRTLVCVRRGQRREVLHALRKTGRGSGGGVRKLTPNSRIRCR